MEKEQNPISINKKHNVRYWEGLDNLTEDYVRDLAAASIPEKKFKEETIMTLAKDVLSFAVKQLESKGCKFPYVDENY